MRFCETHWTSLKTAIEERGLMNLVSDDGKKASERMVDEATNGLTIANFDPLMRAHNAILENCMRAAGSQAMEIFFNKSDEEPHWCPICFCNENNPYGYNYDIWIEYGADFSKKTWESLSKDELGE